MAEGFMNSAQLCQLCIPVTGGGELLQQLRLTSKAHSGDNGTHNANLCAYKKLLVTKGIATIGARTLLGAPGIATRSKNANY